MIYIFSAFYAEAKNIIDHYGLKKEKSLAVFSKNDKAFFVIYLRLF